MGPTNGHAGVPVFKSHKNMGKWSRKDSFFLFVWRESGPDHSVRFLKYFPPNWKNFFNFFLQFGLTAFDGEKSGLRSTAPGKRGYAGVAGGQHSADNNEWVRSGPRLPTARGCRRRRHRRRCGRSFDTALAGRVGKTFLSVHFFPRFFFGSTFEYAPSKVRYPFKTKAEEESADKKQIKFIGIISWCALQNENSFLKKQISFGKKWKILALSDVNVFGICQDCKAWGTDFSLTDWH